MDKEKLIQFWIDSANDNYKSMLNMFNNGEYMWSLFVGHLAIEKLLKAYYVKACDKDVPHTHNLYKLAVKSKIELSESQKDSLQKITLFNIKTRYEDIKKSFYHKCTKEFTEDNIKIIKGLTKCLKQKISK